jgi:MYXO-CTERM domain-containing protein
MTHARSVVVITGALSLLATHDAHAANGNRPRTPVVWTAGECATIVDQSQSPILSLEYTVAVEEDPDARTEDEVDDSRTHQFFAMAQQDIGAMPVWISQADIDRAAQVDPEVVALGNVDPEEILESGSRFPAGTWVRITPDDARVPITFAQAAMGVDWDTTGVAPGTYVVWGYTWEPLLNLWVHRPGFVKVIASAAEAAAAGPSIALLASEATLEAGSPFTVPGCADVEPGSTVTLEWGEPVGTTIPQWVVAIEDEPIDDGALALAFVPPDEAANKSIRLRATVTDAQGRSYVAYTTKVLAVLPDPTPSEESGGGGCRIDDAPPGLTVGLLALFALVRRRERRRCVSAP